MQRSDLNNTTGAGRTTAIDVTTGIRTAGAWQRPDISSTELA